MTPVPPTVVTPATPPASCAACAGTGIARPGFFQSSTWKWLRRSLLILAGTLLPALGPVLCALIPNVIGQKLCTVGVAFGSAELQKAQSQLDVEGLPDGGVGAAAPTPAAPDPRLRAFRACEAVCPPSSIPALRDGACTCTPAGAGSLTDGGVGALIIPTVMYASCRDTLDGPSDCALAGVMP